MHLYLRLLIAVLFGASGLGLVVLGGGPASSETAGPTMNGAAVPRARCGPDDRPEKGIQGRVPLKARESGRSQRGYTCNLQMLGQFQGEGSSWVSQSYKHCAYMSTRFPGSADHPGVQVIDVRDPRHPERVGALTDPAMLGTWETLKVNRARGLLAAVNATGPAGNGVASFAVYDIRSDCLHPELLNSVADIGLPVPANGVGHEGNWSPDGLTYWATSANAGLVTAIDVSDPTTPHVIFEGRTAPNNHGLSVSQDGRYLYIAKLSTSSGTDDNGLQIYDVSEIQDRAPAPQMHLVGEALWSDGALGQHAVNVTYDGRPYVLFVDEGGAGAARIIDISDPTDPEVVSKLKLEIHLPENADLRAKDTEGTGFFGYEAHYCDVDRHRDPTAVACGYFQSGVRVFDVRDPLRPREIAYFNPPAQLGRNSELQSSEHANGAISGGGTATLSTDWCSSPPRFVGRRQLWVTCQDNGFLTLRFTHDVYPLR